MLNKKLSRVLDLVGVGVGIAIGEKLYNKEIKENNQLDSITEFDISTLLEDNSDVISRHGLSKYAKMLRIKLCKSHRELIQINQDIFPSSNTVSSSSLNEGTIELYINMQRIHTRKELLRLVIRTLLLYRGYDSGIKDCSETSYNKFLDRESARIANKLHE